MPHLWNKLPYDGSQDLYIGYGQRQSISRGEKIGESAMFGALLNLHLRVSTKLLHLLKKHLL